MQQTIKDMAEAYEHKQSKNIAELSEVLVSSIVVEETNTEFPYHYITIDGERYRVPNKVFMDLKLILEKKPTLTKFSVSRSGTGINTKYTVIPLE
jgi:hypothetical protein